MAAVDFRAGSTAIGGMGGKGGGGGGGKQPQRNKPGRDHEESEDDYDSDEFRGFSDPEGEDIEFEMSGLRIVRNHFPSIHVSF